MRRHLSIIICLFLLGSWAWGQSDSIPNKWAIQANFQHQDQLIQIPFGQLGTVYKVSIRPLYSVDFQRFFYLDKVNNGFACAQVGYYHNLYHDRSAILKIGGGVERKLGPHFFASLRLETGLAIIKNTDVRYVFEEGKWVRSKNTDAVAGNFLIDGRMDLGARLVQGRHPLDVTGTGQLMFQATRIGVFPMYSAGLGLRIGL